MLCQFQVYSKVIQLYIYLFSNYFPIQVIYRILNEFLVLYNRSLLVIYFIYLSIIVDCAGPFLLCGLSLVAVSRCFSLVLVHGLFNAVASLVAKHSLQGVWTSVAVASGLSRFSAQAQLPHETWRLPGPGIYLMSPAFQGRFLTTGPPGTSGLSILNQIIIWW